jgi:hypothetical protein
MAFDKERAVRILGEQAEVYEEMLRDHVSAEHGTLEQLMTTHAELEADRETVIGLKEYVEEEYDCS